MLELLPNLVHISVPKGPDNIVMHNFTGTANGLPLVPWKDFLERVANLSLERNLPSDVTFQRKELPRLYFSEATGEFISLVTPEQGWDDFEARKDLVCEYLRDRSFRLVSVCAENLEHEAALQIDVLADDGRKLASIMSLTDFVARKLGLKMAKSSALSKSIHDNGLCWMTVIRPTSTTINAWL